MAKVIGFYGLLKNTGKTVSCAFMAECLANLNLRVLVIDLDLNFGLTKYVLGSDFSDEIKTTQLKIKKNEVGWDLRPIGSKILENVSNLFGNIKQEYDFILVDFPSFDSQNSKDFMLNLDSVILPIECEKYGLNKFEETLAKILEFENLVIEGILVTMVSNERDVDDAEVIQMINENFKKIVFETKISRSYYLGLPHFSMDGFNKSVPHFGFMNYLRLTNELINR